MEGEYEVDLCRLAWIDGVKVAKGNRGMTVETARRCSKDRK